MNIVMQRVKKISSHWLATEKEIEELIRDFESDFETITDEDDDLEYIDDELELNDFEGRYDNHQYDCNDIPVVNTHQYISHPDCEYHEGYNKSYDLYNWTNPDENGHIQEKIVTADCDLFKVYLCKTTLGSDYYEVIWVSERGKVASNSIYRNPGNRAIFSTGDIFLPAEFDKTRFNLNCRLGLGTVESGVNIYRISGVLNTETGNVENITVDGTVYYVETVKKGYRFVEERKTKYIDDIFDTLDEFVEFINDVI